MPVNRPLDRFSAVAGAVAINFAVGAVSGQLAGALYGVNAIPERWLTNLAWRPRILTMADALLTAAEPPDGR
jgi:ADP-ribosylglycohydrolase